MLPSPIPNPREEVDAREKACALAEQWGITSDLALRLMEAQAEIPFDLWIFSGARDEFQQARVSRTPFHNSNHATMDWRGCPRLATAADVQPSSPAIRAMPMAVAQMGAAFVRHGLRWGGGAPVGDDGIPVGNERWHVDTGPRRS
jgi:hypothetical protein